jgi:hypothetical protein
MEVAHVEGTVAALVPFPYDFSGEAGGKKGTSWSVWIAGEFGAEKSEPMKVKLPDPEQCNAVHEAGIGATISVDYALSANVRGTTAVIDRRALSVQVKGRRQLKATA